MLVEILTYHAEEATQAVLGYVEKEAQSVMRKLLLEAYEQVVSKGLVPNKPVQALVVNK